MYLLDTHVVSELRSATRCDPSVAAWAQASDSRTMYLSVISLLELEIGVMRVERRDPEAGKTLRDWLDRRVMTTFAGRSLPIDLDVVKAWAPFHVPNRRPERDALIAATALHHRLTLVTRNVRDFEGLDVKLLNPWSWSPV